MDNYENLLNEQINDFEIEVVRLCEDCKRALDDKDFINFSRILSTIGNVVQRVAPIVSTAAQVAQKLT